MTEEFLRKYPDVMDVEQVCEVLMISKRTAYRLIKGGQIETQKLGRKHIVLKKSLIGLFRI